MYKQTESKYRSIKLGNGDGSLYNFGCYLFSLVNGLNDFSWNYTPEQFNQFLVNNNSFTGEFGNYINVDKLDDILPNIFESYKRTDTWIGFDSVDWYLSRNYILVAKVDARGIGGSGSHFVRVVSTTNKTMTIIQDPWFGTTDPVTKHYNAYDNILSFRIFKVKENLSSINETMTDNQEETYTKEQWDKLRTENQDNWDKWQDEKTKLETCNTTKGTISGNLQSTKDNHEEFVNKLIFSLNPDPTQYKDVSKEDMVQIEVDAFIKREDDLLRSHKEKDKLVVEIQRQYDEKIEKLDSDVARLTKDLNTVSDQLDQLKDEEKPVIEDKPSLDTVNKVKDAFDRLISLIITIFKRR